METRRRSGALLQSARRLNMMKKTKNSPPTFNIFFSALLYCNTMLQFSNKDETLSAYPGVLMDVHVRKNAFSFTHFPQCK